MSLDERKREWCKTIGKDISYAFDFYHKNFDEMDFPSRKLSLKWNQRSIDVPLGLPYNIASYAILLNLLSKEVNMIPDKLILSGGDCHIYKNQVDAIKEQFNNETFELPTIELSNNSLFDVKYDDIKVMNYKSSKTIKIPLSN
jgi:thymidylate synthase